MTKKEIEISNYLANEGFLFSEELHNLNKDYLQNLDANYFAIACAISLCWTGHAKYETEFIEYASDFIDGKIAKDDSISISFCKRFSAEQLDLVLVNFRKFSNRVKHLMPDFNTCSVQEINKLQQRLLNVLNELRNTNFIKGIGPWLFLGPFKIILGDQKRLWKVNGIDAIVLPTGIEVDRGIIRLKNEGFNFMKDFDENWLKEQTGSLLDNYATCTMVHTHIRKISEISNSSALHLNSALYKYGRKDI